MSKIVIAPDSFKGSLSAAKLADIVEKAAKEQFPHDVAIKIPIADGGEGTLEALLMAVGGEKKRARVTGAGWQAAVGGIRAPFGWFLCH